MLLTYFLSRIPAGFPNPGQGEESERLDVRTFLIVHPLNTFFFRLERPVPSEKLISGDVLVVDRVETPHARTLVLGTIDGEFRVCRGHSAEGLEVWGVVVAMMRRI